MSADDGAFQSELERRTIQYLSLWWKDESLEALSQLQAGTAEWLFPREQERLHENGQAAAPHLSSIMERMNRFQYTIHRSIVQRYVPGRKGSLNQSQTPAGALTLRRAQWASMPVQGYNFFYATLGASFTTKIDAMAIPWLGKDMLRLNIIARRSHSTRSWIGTTTPSL